MSKKNPQIDEFLRDHPQWSAEFVKLRHMLLEAGLTEELKWNQPTYTYNKSIVAMLAGFRDYCALSFFKGVLLKDPTGVLTAHGENSRLVRYIRFTDPAQVDELEAVIKVYIIQAIEIEKTGMKVEVDNDDLPPIPDELQEKMDEMPALRDAFEALTPGRRRGYILYFSAPKHSATRTTRIEKCTDMIMDGLGLHDEYRGK